MAFSCFYIGKVFCRDEKAQNSALYALSLASLGKATTKLNKHLFVVHHPAQSVPQSQVYLPNGKLKIS
jgi:hypothetical protein